MSYKNLPSFEIAFPKDYKVLLSGLIDQAMTDYVKLQHPSYRNKTYMQEAFLNAVDMFFDETFEFAFVEDEHGQPMTTHTLLEFMVGRNVSNKMDKLHEHLASQARKYWKKKKMRTLKLPDQICVHGFVYDVRHHEEEEHKINYDERVITLNKKKGSDAEKMLVQAVLEICAYHQGGRYKMSALRELGEVLFLTLKVNDCFTGS